MKGVIIKNLKLPKNCWVCPLLDDEEYGKCTLTHSTMCHVNYRNKDCPLEEVEIKGEEKK